MQGTNGTNGALKTTKATNGTNGTNGINGTNGSTALTPTSATTSKPPGMVNGFPKAGDGEWDRTGWAPRFGSLNDALGLDDAIAENHQTFVEASLGDKFFGGKFWVALRVG